MPRTTRDGMEARREKFAQEYVANGFNGAAAARAAGYPSGTAKWRAQEFLAEPATRKRIEKLKADYFRRLQVDRLEVLARLSVMATADVAKCFDENGKLRQIHDMDPEIRACITSYEEGKVRLEPRLPALAILAKYHRVIGTETVDVTVKDERPAIDQIELARRVAFLLASAAHSAKPEQPVLEHQG